MDKEKFYGTMGVRSQTAASKRSTQLKNWDQSDTNKESESIKASRAKPKVQFGDSIVFLAAAQSGDIEEVERLLHEGADVNAVNSDGLTGLHQCCIDDDFEMVETLVKLGANVDAQDNEGWSPLHAAASCGHEHIVRFLLEHKAHPALVNNEGDTPLDLADEYEEIAELLSSHIETHSIDVDAAKNMEEARMLEDANRLKNDSTLVAPISPGGATLLHVAAAKGYLKVMDVLLSMKVEVDALDEDGWTPLHAAVYWRNMDAAELLVSHGADITRTTKAGDTIEDLVDPELADNLDSLKKLKEEHNNRHRRYALSSTRSSRPSLTHANSRDELKSPNLLRRRSSKERSLAVHKLDKEREKFPSTTPTILPNELNDKNHISNKEEVSQDREQESNNSAKEVALLNENSDPVKSIDILSPPTNEQSSEMQSASSPVVSSSENSPTGSPRASPKIIAKIAPGTKSPQKGKKMSPNMMKRVGLWESQSTITPLASSTPDKPEVKRYTFQPRTISSESRSNSLDPTTTTPPSVVSSRRTTYDSSNKRASYDERRLKESLTTPGTEYKASSLPRGATISPVPTPVVSSSLPRGTKINTPTVNTESTVKENDGAVSSSGAPTPSADTQESSGLSRELSVDSPGNNRSGSESETKRKHHARRSRQQRQPTQPVDNDILQKLLHKDKLESQESAESSPEIQRKDHSSPEVQHKDHSSPEVQRKDHSSPEVQRKDHSSPESIHKDLSSVVSVSSPDSSPPVKQKASAEEADKSTTPLHPRSKSVARRKPKHPRRSTGLPFEAEEGEEIPEELANIITRRPSEDSSIAQEDEVVALRKQLASEKEWRERIKKEKEEMSKEVDNLKSKVSELNRRHGDATRAYEQEKRERELKEARILELENSSKNLQDLKKECQRLKDENSALIRVIGKLSRSPLPTSTV